MDPLRGGAGLGTLVPGRVTGVYFVGSVVENGGSVGGLWGNLVGSGVTPG